MSNAKYTATKVHQPKMPRATHRKLPSLTKSILAIAIAGVSLTAQAGKISTTPSVTGAAGFIGYHLAERLLREGRRVVGLDNLNDYYDVSLKRARLCYNATQYRPP